MPTPLPPSAACATYTKYEFRIPLRDGLRLFTTVYVPKDAFDILEGFEGDRDAEGHRETVGGWCKHGLPWA